MIRILCGEAGAGKSKQIIDMANETMQSAKGTVVFVDMGTQYMYDLKRDIRHVDASEYRIKGPKMVFGFLSGMAAQDFDLEYLYVDSFEKIVGHPLAELEGFFADMDAFAERNHIHVVLSISYDEAMPPFLAKYII